MSVYLGLDCGGSTTRALAVDTEGATLFEGSSGSANLATTPERVLRANLARAIKGCPQPTVVCGCFAGLLTEAGRTRGAAYLSELFPASIIKAEPDYAAAYYAAETPIDVCVIAGTGSLVCSRINGSWVRSGGRGYLLGDAGSAFDVGRHGLRFWLTGGYIEDTNLTLAVERIFGSKTPDEVVADLYASRSPVVKLARLAPAIAKAAKKETLAFHALQAAMSHLSSDLFVHLATKFEGAGTVRIGLVGGLWQASPSVLEAFESELKKMRGVLKKMQISEVAVQRIKRPPVRGAVAIAMELTLGN